MRSFDHLRPTDQSHGHDCPLPWYTELPLSFGFQPYRHSLVEGIEEPIQPSTTQQGSIALKTGASSCYEAVRPLLHIPVPPPSARDVGCRTR